MLIANQAHIRDDRSATWLEEPSVRALTFVWYARHLAQLENIIMFCNSSHVMYYIFCFVLCTKKWKASLFCLCFYNWNYHSPLYFKHFHYIWQVLFSPHAKFKHLHVRPCTYNHVYNTMYRVLKEEEVAGDRRRLSTLLLPSHQAHLTMHNLCGRMLLADFPTVVLITRSEQCFQLGGIGILNRYFWIGIWYILDDTW